MKDAIRRYLMLERVCIDLAGQRLFEPLNLAVAPGQVVTLMGPSGCGKSTLLAYLCGVLDPAFKGEGRVVLDGQTLHALPPERRGVGILFQDALLFPHLTVAENLAFGLPNGLNRKERRRQVRAALRDAGLEDFGPRDPKTLSGGQRTRVALMRTLLSKPRALLLDEPFSKLDAELRTRMRAFVFDHTRSQRLPTLMVTHDPADADAAGGPVILL